MRTPSSLHHILAAIVGGTALAAGVFACGGSDASAVRETLAASGASLASRPHTFETSDEVTRALGLGTHRRYALRLSSSTDAGAMQLQVAIRGELDVAFVDSPAGGSRFRIALSTLTLEGNAFGPVDGDTARVVVRELEQPFFVTFEPSGRVRELHVPATKSSTIAGLRKNVAALLQYEVRGDSAWTSTEDDATGSFESAYTLTSGRELSRAKKRYTALFTPEGPTPIVGDTTMEVAGTFVATLDRGFWPREAKLDERASLRVGTLMSATSEHHDRLELLDSGDERVHVGAFAREGSGYETVTFRSLEIFAAQREALDHGYLRGRNAQQLLEEAASEDATVGNDALVGLTALFRLSPQSVRDVAATLRRYDIVTQRFIGAAVAAETAEAQAVVSEMALDRRLPLAQRRDAVMGLAMIEHPDASTLAAARRLVNDANREIADTAELALGAVAGRARAEAPEEANDAVNVLLERLRHASSAGETAHLLRALANAADPRVVPFAATFVRSESAEVREAACDALGRVASDETSALLVAVVAHDPDASVRAHAVECTSGRPLEPFFAALSSAALEGTTEALRIAAIVRLSQALPNAAVIDVLRRAADVASTDLVRQAALGALGTPSR